MPAPGEQQETVKMLQKGLRSSLFAAKSFPVGALHLSLDAALVEAAIEIVQTGPEIQGVKTKAGAGSESRRALYLPVEGGTRSQLSILPSAVFRLAANGVQQL